MPAWERYLRALPRRKPSASIARNPWAKPIGEPGKAILFGEGLVFACLALGTATVSFDHSRLLLPELDVLGETGLLGLAGAVAVTALASWSALHFSPMTTRLLMRLLFFGLLLGFYFNARRLTDVAVPGIALCVAAAASGVYLLRKEVCPQ